MGWDTLHNSEPLTEKVMYLVGFNHRPFRVHGDSWARLHAGISVDHVTKCRLLQSDLEIELDVVIHIGESKSSSSLVSFSDRLEELVLLLVG
jgi:hypothetical protein